MIEACSCRLCNTECAQLLLRRGANPTAKNSYEQTVSNSCPQRRCPRMTINLFLIIFKGGSPLLHFWCYFHSRPAAPFIVPSRQQRIHCRDAHWQRRQSWHHSTSRCTNLATFQRRSNVPLQPPAVTATALVPSPCSLICLAPALISTAAGPWGSLRCIQRPLVVTPISALCWLGL